VTDVVADVVVRRDETQRHRRLVGRAEEEIANVAPGDASVPVCRTAPGIGGAVAEPVCGSELAVKGGSEEGSDGRGEDGGVA